jgi:hypothetical protein
MEKFYRLSLAARVAIAAAVTFFVLLAYRELLDLWFFGIFQWFWMVPAAVVALLVAVVTVVVDRRLRRNFGSIEQYIGYSNALRTGVPPMQIDRDVWRRWLHYSRRQTRLLAWAAVLIAVFVVLPNLHYRPGRPYHWVVASVYGSLAVLMLVSWRLRRARISRLAAAVEQR